MNSCGYDYFRLKVGTTTLISQTLCSSTNTNGWVHGSINLSSYVNSTIILKFEAATDSSIPSLIFLDDIYLASTATASPESFDPGALDSDFTWKEDW